MTAMRLTRTFAIAALTAAVTLTSLPAAGVAGILPRSKPEAVASGAPVVEIGDRRHRRGYDAGIAAGVIGLAAGALIGGALAAPAPAPIYVDPYVRSGVRIYTPRIYTQDNLAPRYYHAPPYVGRSYGYAPRLLPAPVYGAAPVYRSVPRARGGRFEPWTQAWYRDCDRRYRSFDPDSGTFLGYDGRRHFCN